MRDRTTLPLAFLAACSVSLVGCETLQEASEKLAEMAAPGVDAAEQRPARGTATNATAAASSLKPALRIAPPSTPVGRDYQVTKSANLRGGPGIDYETVGGLAEGAKVRVEAKVDGRNWYIVRSGQCGLCFLHERLARPLEVVQATVADKEPGEPHPRPFPPGAVLPPCPTAAPVSRRPWPLLGLFSLGGIEAKLYEFPVGRVDELHRDSIISLVAAHHFL